MYVDFLDPSYDPLELYSTSQVQVQVNWRMVALPPCNHLQSPLLVQSYMVSNRKGP